MDVQKLIDQGWIEEHATNPEFVKVTVEGVRLVLTLLQCLYECDPHNYNRVYNRITPEGIERGNRSARRSNARRRRPA